MDGDVKDKITKKYDKIDIGYEKKEADKGNSRDLEKINININKNVGLDKFQIVLGDNVSAEGCTFMIDKDDLADMYGLADVNTSTVFGLNGQKINPTSVDSKYAYFAIDHFSTNVITDWASSDHSRRLKIVIDSDRETNGINDVNNSTQIFWFTDSNASGAITDGDDDKDDFRFYAYNASGSGFGTTVTECYYDAYYWNTDANGSIAVNVPHIDGDAETVLYMYYDGDGDWDDPTNTYYNGKQIYNFIDLNDASSSGLNLTNSGATQGVITDTGYKFLGKGYTFNGSNYMYTASTTYGGTWTVITFYKPASLSSTNTLFDKGTTSAVTGHSPWNYLFNTDTKFYTNVASGSASDNMATSGTISTSTWYMLTSIFDDGTNNFDSYINTTITDDSTTTTQDATSNRTTIGATWWGGSNVNYANGVMGFLWTFSDAKSDSWVKSLYYSCVNNAWYTYASENVPTFAFDSNAPSGAIFDTEVDGNVTITAPTTWGEIEEVNVSYSDNNGSTYTIIDANVTSADGCVSSWDGDAYIRLNINSSAWSDDTDYRIKYICYDGASYFTVISNEFNIGTVNVDPNKASVIYFGTDTNATETIYDEDSGLTFQITAKITNSSDPDGDNQWFALLVDDDSTFATPYYNSSYKDDPADLNMSVTRDMERNKIWYVRVDNVDGNGGTNSSDIFKVYLGNHSPTAVTHATPADNSSTRDTTPTFNWTLASPEDSDGENVFYAVYVIDGEDNVDYNSGFKDGNVTATATALDLDSYMWKVVAKDKDVNANYIDDTNTSVWTLDIIANSAPNDPTITSIGGVSDVNGTVYDENTGTSGYLLNLKGYNASDPDGDNMTHRWSWATAYADLYTSPSNNSAWLDNPADINSSTITDALTRNAYWYVGLQSKDDYDGSTGETFWKVLVENRVPSKPVVTAPSGTIYDTTPSITWGASTDGDGDDFNYCVVVKDSLDNVDINSTYLSSVTSGYTTTALDIDSYNIYIYVYDGYDTNVSDAGSFTLIENTAPNKATINTIGGEANTSNIYDGDSGAGFQLTFDGTNSSDPDGDNQNWAWVIDDNSSFSSVDYNTTFSTPLDQTFATALRKNMVWYFRLDATDPAGSGDVNSSDLFTMTMENYAPNAVTPTSPTNSSTIYDTTPTFEWTLATPEDSDGDNVFYALYVYDSGDALDYNSGFKDGNVTATATALDLDSYMWKVIAYDSDGTYYYDVTNSSVMIFTLIANTNPDKPTITSIGNDANTSTIYDEDSGSGFQITRKGYNASDYDGDAQEFKWDVDDDSDFSSPLITVDSLGSGDINGTFTTALTKKAYYWFRLGAIDPLGANEYNYSTPFYMYLGNRVPTSPAVTAPTTTTYDTTPSITWTNSSDLDGDTLQYRVEISNASGVVRQSAYGVSQPYTNATALDYGNYNITIYVYDQYDTNTSAIETFEVISNHPPNAPTITSVAGADTNTTVYDQDATANVLWYLRGYNSSDPDSDNQDFKWEIDDNNDFGSPEYSADSLAVGDINMSMTTALNRNTYYYVRLGARDPAGSNEYNYSQILYLLFENYAPTAGSLTSPDDNSTTCDTTVFLSWETGTDTDGDSLTMQVRVYDSLGNYDYNNSFSTDVNATTGILTADTYTWKVVYYDGYDYTNSSTRTFNVVDNAVPSVPTPSSPTNYAKDINPVDVALDWTDSSDTCGDAITYVVQWTTDYSFTHYSEYATATNSSTYTITTELYTEQVYYWRVKSVDVVGSSSWSSIYEFQTESASGGSGSDQYEVRSVASYDEDSGTVEVISWIQKNGVQMTGISGVSIVVKDDSNTTVHTSNSGTVYSDGFYRDSWSAVGWHGLYSMKTTLTYSGSTYYGGSYFDAGIMEIHDALDSMTTTINLIEGYTDSLEGNMSTVMTYIGDPADTSSDSTLFGYSQFLKDKWGSYTAETIYNKVVDVYNLASDINSSDIAYLKSTLSDLDTYIDTYSGVDISVGATYNFYSDQLELNIAYIKDGEIKDTTSCTTLLKEQDGDTLKTFTDADDADYIYRYEWNSSATDFPDNGFYGAYTIIPSVVYNGNTYTTVREFSAELPDLYGTSAYTDTLTAYSDSGYSVTASTANARGYIYLKCTSTEAMDDLSNVSYSVYWEDSDGNTLATTTGTGSVSSNVMRIPLTVPEISGNVTLRLYAYETVYGHRTTTMSGTSSSVTIYNNVGSGYTQPISKAEIRIVPDAIKSGDTIRLGFVCERRGTIEAVGMLNVRLVDSNENIVMNDDYAVTMKEKLTDVMIDCKTPLTLKKGVYELQILRDGFILDTHEISVSEAIPSGGSIVESIKRFRWEIPGTDIVISFE